MGNPPRPRNTSSCSEQSSCSFWGGERDGHTMARTIPNRPHPYTVHSSRGQKESPGKAGSLWRVVVVSWPRTCLCVCVCVWISDNIVGKPQYIQAVCLTVSSAWCVCVCVVLDDDSFSHYLCHPNQTTSETKRHRLSEPCVKPIETYSLKILLLDLFLKKYIFSFLNITNDFL